MMNNENWLFQEMRPQSSNQPACGAAVACEGKKHVSMWQS